MVRLPDCRAFRPGKAFTAERGPQAAGDCYYSNGKDARAVANLWGEESVRSRGGRREACRLSAFRLWRPPWTGWSSFLSCYRHLSWVTLSLWWCMGLSIYNRCRSSSTVRSQGVTGERAWGEGTDSGGDSRLWRSLEGPAVVTWHTD